MTGDLQVGRPPTDMMVAAPQPDHDLGPVADDWEAVEVWLRVVARKSRTDSGATLATYRFHLAKLRWYCEHVARVTPSRWTLQDVEAFKAFLENVPVDALCARVGPGERFVTPGEPGYSPFRAQPAPGSQADIARFVHALFTAWHKTGYIRRNPMAIEGAGARRTINARRSIDIDLYDLVLATMERETFIRPTSRHINARDRFLLVALRELGLRASELVGSSMSAFQQILDPQTKRRYWIFQVEAAVAKGGAGRAVPVTGALLKALEDYRLAFGLPAHPISSERTALLLSPHTDAGLDGRGAASTARTRRYLRAWKELTTRQHVYAIVKARLMTTARILHAEHPDLAAQLEQASPHWLRHTFAKAALNQGQSMREVAGLLGHTSMDTTMVYTNQGALDAVRAYERVNMDPAEGS